MTLRYGTRTVSMLDLHLALSAIVWGSFVLLPPNNMFHNYVTLKLLGEWGLSELVSGVGAILGGFLSSWATFYGSYVWRRSTMAVACAWWTLVTVSSFHTATILPASGLYALTAVMAGVQAVKAKHRKGSEKAA